jgi:hypothetical protein
LHDPKILIEKAERLNIIFARAGVKLNFKTLLAGVK